MLAEAGDKLLLKSFVIVLVQQAASTTLEVLKSSVILERHDTTHIIHKVVKRLRQRHT